MKGCDQALPNNSAFIDVHTTQDRYVAGLSLSLSLGLPYPKHNRGVERTDCHSTDPVSEHHRVHAYSVLPGWQLGIESPQVIFPKGSVEYSIVGGFKKAKETGFLLSQNSSKQPLYSAAIDSL